MPSRHSDRGRALRAANETTPPSDMYNAVTAALEEKLSPEELYPAALMKFMVSPTAPARNTVAQTLGLLGDIEELIAAAITPVDFGAPHAIRSTADAPDSSAGMMPNSEEMARMLGGNPDHPSWLPAALLAPGPGEFIAGAKVAAKALVAGMKGVGEFAPGVVSFAQALFHGTPSGVGKVEIRLDNPGGEWLEHQRSRAKETGYLGDVTAYLKDHKPVMVNPKALKYIPGARGEHIIGANNQRGVGSKAKAIRESLRSGENIREPIFITVDYRGKALISEGNNRLAVAIEEGVSEIPVEIRWFAGGEQVDGPLSPENLQRLVDETAKPTTSGVD